MNIVLCRSASTFCRLRQHIGMQIFDATRRNEALVLGAVVALSETKDLLMFSVDLPNRVDNVSHARSNSHVRGGQCALPPTARPLSAHHSARRSAESKKGRLSKIALVLSATLRAACISSICARPSWSLGRRQRKRSAFSFSIHGYERRGRMR